MNDDTDNGTRMIRTPYIGVTGFMSAREVREARRAYGHAWAAMNVQPTHALMVGVLASSKTLRGIPNKYPRRYPPVADIGTILRDGCSISIGLPDEPERLGLIHYASDEAPSLDDLVKLAELGGPFCDGCQFNGEWPEPQTLVDAVRHVPWFQCVLQLGPRFLQACNWNSTAIVEKLKPYGGLAENGRVRVLIDASGGRGVAMPWSEDAMWERIDALRDAFPTMGIGVAGGLCAGGVHHVAPFMRDGCSIDAEGLLRDNAMGGGNLDLDAMRAYLVVAVALASGINQRKESAA